MWDWLGPWHMWSGGWGGWWIFPLVMMLFMVAMCLAMFYMMVGRHGNHASRDTTRSALQVLNERFARGEIQKQEYEERKAAIVSN